MLRAFPATGESLPPDALGGASHDFTTDLDRNLESAEALRPIADRHGA